VVVLSPSNQMSYEYLAVDHNPSLPHFQLVIPYDQTVLLSVIRDTDYPFVTGRGGPLARDV
jgi:hypothetical protein